MSFEISRVLSFSVFQQDRKILSSPALDVAANSNQFNPIFYNGKNFPFHELLQDKVMNLCRRLHTIPACNKVAIFKLY